MGDDKALVHKSADATGTREAESTTVFDWGTSYVQRFTTLGVGSLEHEADRVGEELLRKAPGGGPLQGSGSGTSLAPNWRSAFERQLGRDLSTLKIHDDESAHERADAISARAYTQYGDIHLGRSARQHGPDRVAHTVAHEVVHAAQQAQSARSGLAAPLRSASPHIPLREPQVPGTIEIPAKWLRKPKRNELLIFSKGDRMAVLPAIDSIRYVDVPKDVQQVAQASPTPNPFTAFATIGKNASMAVRVSGTTAFLIDVGGSPSVVVPGALNAIERGLGVNDISDIIITHAHLDHASSVGAVALRYGIKPANVSFPAEFLDVPAFRGLMERLAEDPDLGPLGWGPNANFNLIQTQSATGFYRVVRTQGDVEFVYAGLSRPAREGFTGGAAGRTQVDPKQVDAGSMIIRVTNKTTGKAELYLSDMRGETREELHGLMGDTAYNELVSGVDTLVMYSHHMGVAYAGDLSEHADLIIRSGATRVTVQSQETYGAGQFLNRSQIQGLNELGIDVEVLHEAGPAGPGTVVHDASGASQTQGGGVELLPATARGVEARTRLNTLRRIVQVVDEFEEFAGSDLQVSAVRAARQRLETEWESYVEFTMSNVLEGRATHGQPTFKDPAEQEARATRLAQRDPIEEQFTPAYMNGVAELARLGPAYRTYKAELEKARTSGELSEEGFDAMWEINPGAAQRLLQASGMTRGARRKIGQYMPGQDFSAGTRATAGFLLGLEIFNELIYPAVLDKEASDYNSHVAPFLEIIQWWKRKGVTPSLQGVNDRWWPRSNVWTHDENEIVELLDSGDLDWLAMTDIPGDDQWENFMLWASTNLTDYNDFQFHIWNSNAVTFNEQGWVYKTGEVNGTWSGHEMTTRWKPDPRLTTIMNASLHRVAVNTERTLAQKMTSKADSTHMQTTRAPDDVMGVLANLPPPTGRFRFRPGKPDGTMYVLSKGGMPSGRHGYRDLATVPIPGNLLVYAYPPSAVDQFSGDTVPEDLVVVSGADWDSYRAIRDSPNRTKQIVGYFTSGDASWGPYNTPDNPWEVLLARASDLEPAP